MPRPRKWRRVCGMPGCARFGPLGREAVDAVVMTVDEYETIRLMDWENCSQEQCAARMGIARTTVQGIYMTARRKVADVLVHGRVLSIEGGDYQLCETAGRCGVGKGACPRCGQHMNTKGQMEYE